MKRSQIKTIVSSVVKQVPGGYELHVASAIYKLHPTKGWRKIAARAIPVKKVSGAKPHHWQTAQQTFYNQGAPL